jgi:hypothetical protein
MNDFAFGLLSIFTIVSTLFTITLAVLYIWSIFWSYQDAVKRKKNGLAVAVLVALFAWPFGLLFWTIMRPERVSKTIKPVNLKKPNQYQVSFREMSWLLKLFSIFSVYSLLIGLSDLVANKTVEIQMIGINFPANLSFLWHTYSILISVYTILVLFKRSYSALKTYIYVSLVGMIPIVLNCIYDIVNAPAEYQLGMFLTYTMTSVFVGLIYLYLFKQKKYFSNP